MVSGRHRQSLHTDTIQFKFQQFPRYGHGNRAQLCVPERTRWLLYSQFTLKKGFNQSATDFLLSLIFNIAINASLSLEMCVLLLLLLPRAFFPSYFPRFPFFSLHAFNFPFICVSSTENLFFPVPVCRSKQLTIVCWLFATLLFVFAAVFSFAFCIYTFLFGGLWKRTDENIHRCICDWHVIHSCGAVLLIIGFKRGWLSTIPFG